jgi:hypothetical protein
MKKGALLLLDTKTHYSNGHPRRISYIRILVPSDHQYPDRELLRWE